MSRVRENRMHGSRWRREETQNQSASPRGTGRLPPTLQVGRYWICKIARPGGYAMTLFWEEFASPRADLAAREGAGVPGEEATPPGRTAQAGEDGDWRGLYRIVSC